MAKVLCVLYDDPVDGYPRSYARDAIPRIERYDDGQTTPTPERIDFEPGELLGSVSGELGLRRFLEERGHALVVTSDKDGPDSLFERELPDAAIVISQPFWPAYLTAKRIAKAPGLKLAVTAGIGSDHVDLEAAIERGITVAEITYSNSISRGASPRRRPTSSWTGRRSGSTSSAGYSSPAPWPPGYRSRGGSRSSRRPRHVGEVLGVGHRPAGCGPELRLLDRKRTARRRPLGTAVSASAAYSPSSSPI